MMMAKNLCAIMGNKNKNLRAIMGNKIPQQTTTSARRLDCRATVMTFRAAPARTSDHGSLAGMSAANTVAQGNVQRVWVRS